MGYVEHQYITDFITTVLFHTLAGLVKTLHASVFPDDINLEPSTMLWPEVESQWCEAFIFIMNQTYGLGLQQEWDKNGSWVQCNLTHWGQDKMGAISQMTFSSAFSLNETFWIPIKISLKFVPKSPINNIPALVEIMAWRRPGDKPLSQPMMVSLLTHISITRPQWVNRLCTELFWKKSISFEFYNSPESQQQRLLNITINEKLWI